MYVALHIVPSFHVGATGTQGCLHMKDEMTNLENLKSLKPTLALETDNPDAMEIESHSLLMRLAMSMAKFSL